jgi:drug/metabolite transporter, DME family
VKHPHLSMIAAALLWSTGGTAIKLAAAAPQLIAGGRALIAGLLMFLLLPDARMRPNVRVLGVASAYAVVCTLFVFATTYTTAGNAIFIQNTSPVWVLLASPLLLGERPTAVQKISVPIALFGCLLFFLDDPELGLLKGNLLAFISGIAYAALVIAWRKVSHAEGLAGTAYGNLVIAAVMVWFVDFGTLDLRGGLVILYLGTIQQALPAILFIRGVRGASAMEASLITLLEPVFSPILAFLVVEERLGPLSIAGGVTIVGATIWRIRAGRNAGDLTKGEER